MAIDKPNVHRLRELVCSTIPIFGMVSRVGKLVLENNSHQTLKRAICYSNKMYTFNRLQVLSLSIGKHDYQCKSMEHFQAYWIMSEDAFASWPVET